MVQTLLSPRGVTDVFSLDTSVSKLEFHDSFRWAESEPIKTKLHQHDHYQHYQQFRRTSSKRLTADEIRAQIIQTQAQIESVHEQSIKDQQDLRDELVQAKKECRKQLEQEFGPSIQQGNAAAAKNNNKARAVGESQKIIQYLRDDNSRLRQEMIMYKKEMDKLQESNAQLEKTNARVDASHKELVLHVATLEKTHAKLEKNAKLFKKALQDMKNEYKRRDSHFKAELRSEKVYEESMTKILSNIQNRSTSAQLIEHTFDIAGEGIAHASNCRNDELAKFGLFPEKTTMMKPFDIMGSIDKKKKKDAKKKSYGSEWDTDSDSDSDSDDE